MSRVLLDEKEAARSALATRAAPPSCEKSMRSSRRDARSLAEIRYLAEQAKENESARQVLHDALLETWPAVYSDVIRRAQNQARREAGETARRHHELGTKHHPDILSGKTNHFIERIVFFRSGLFRAFGPPSHSGATLTPTLVKRFFYIQDPWRLSENDNDIHVYLARARVNYWQPPKPKFNVGDRVRDRDGGRRGIITRIGDYDDYIRQYLYRVADENNHQTYWNERTIVRVRTRAAGR